MKVTNLASDNIFALKNTLAAVTPIEPPEANNLVEYIIIFLMSGGAAVAIKQSFDAYRQWQALKKDSATQIKVEREGVVEKIVTLLETQLVDQDKTYSKRLKDQDTYYKNELAARIRSADESCRRKQRTIDALSDENSRLRKIVLRYQTEFGFLPSRRVIDNYEDEDLGDDEEEDQRFRG